MIEPAATLIGYGAIALAVAFLLIVGGGVIAHFVRRNPAVMAWFLLLACAAVTISVALYEGMQAASSRLSIG